MATAGPGKATLTWAANTETDLSGYVITRNGAVLSRIGKVTTYTDTAVVPGTTYTYTIAATDNSGNVSPASPSASAVPEMVPSVTTSESVSGSFTQKSTSTVVTRTVAIGDTFAKVTASAKGQRAPQVTLTLVDSAGIVLAQQTGSAPSVSYRADAAMALSWKVSGSAGTSWSLALTYQK